jgi:hypothetical protein
MPRKTKAKPKYDEHDIFKIKMFDELTKKVCHKENCGCGGDLELLPEKAIGLPDNIKLHLMNRMVVDQLAGKYNGLGRQEAAKYTLDTLETILKDYNTSLMGR